MRRRPRLKTLTFATVVFSTLAMATAARPPEIPTGAPAVSGRSVVVRPDHTWEWFHTAPAGGSGQTNLVSSVSPDNGLTWSEPKVWCQLPGEGWGGMAAVLTPSDDAHLFITKSRLVGAGKIPAVERYIDVWHVKSSNGRKQWAAPKVAFEGYVGAISDAVRLPSGRILLPFGMMIGGRRAGPPIGRNEVTVIYSDDDGERFTMSPARLTSPCEEDYNGSNEGACEPAIVPLKDGRLWMLMRTQTGFLYQSWSTDDGANWSKAEPSRFHSSTGPPALIRLPDDRIALFWNNCQMPPKHNGNGVYAGRDALHAAIADPTLSEWRGWREIYRDPARNLSPPHKGDRGTAYPEAIRMNDGRIGVYSGQGGRRALVYLDPEWLYETKQSSDLAAGLDDWHVYKFFGEAEGWWRDRTQGAALVDDPDRSAKKVLRVCRPDERSPDGAVWNFPMARRGKLSCRLLLPNHSSGGEIALADRFFDPDNSAGEKQAIFLLPVAAGGKTDTGAALSPGEWHDIDLAWDLEKGSCEVTVDRGAAMTLKQQEKTPNGVCYLRVRSVAEKIDSNGLMLESVSVEIAEPAHETAARR